MVGANFQSLPRWQHRSSGLNYSIYLDHKDSDGVSRSGSELSIAVTLATDSWENVLMMGTLGD